MTGLAAAPIAIWNPGHISSMLNGKQIGDRFMLWLQLFGPGADGKIAVEDINTPFSTIDSAVSEAEALAKIRTFRWGKATGFKVFDEANRIVAEGTFDA